MITKAVYEIENRNYIGLADILFKNELNSLTCNMCKIVGKITSVFRNAQGILFIGPPICLNLVLALKNT